MQNLKFYQVIEDSLVFVHEEKSEFFAIYLSKTNEWIQPENLTFMALTQERDYKEICQEQALKITNQCSPEKIYNDYLSLINANRA